MPEPEEKVEEKDKPIGPEVREKSFQQILAEQQAERAKTPIETTPEPTEEEKAKEAEAKAKEEEEARKKEEFIKKAEDEKQALIAKQAAGEVVKKQEEAKQADLDKQAEADRIKAREEALKPKFTGVDEKGNPTPKTYDELVAEGARIGKEQALAEFEAKQREDRAKEAETKAAQLKTEEDRKAATKAMEDQLQTELDNDLKDLYANNKLPKIKDPKDENDPGNKEFRNLFETAQKVNAERMAKGESPIRSIKLIYYEHYKPLKTPAGGDAPVMGNEPTNTTEEDPTKYNIKTDRNKSMLQLIKEEKARLAKKLNIRGK